MEGERQQRLWAVAARWACLAPLVPSALPKRHGRSWTHRSLWPSRRAGPCSRCLQVNHKVKPPKQGRGEGAVAHRDPPAPKAAAILGEGPSEWIQRPLVTPVGLATPLPPTMVTGKTKAVGNGLSRGHFLSQRIVSRGRWTVHPKSCQRPEARGKGPGRGGGAWLGNRAKPGEEETLCCGRLRTRPVAGREGRGLGYSREPGSLAPPEGGGGPLRQGSVWHLGPGLGGSP